LKHGAGKLTLPEPPRRWWSDQVSKWGLIELTLSAESLFRGSELPKHHKDPFDRVILAQAQMDNLFVVSPDAEFPAYELPLIW
jgi:PIN domain nuclease of toxin-antitoxin system